MKYLPLTNSDRRVIVDEIDYIWLSVNNWQLMIAQTGSMRIQRIIGSGLNKKTLTMSREIMKYHGYNIENLDIDHINGDAFDNRLENLRPCNDVQNGANARISKANTSGYKGVCWHHRLEKFQAYITINRKHLHLGYYDTAEDAAWAYDRAAMRYSGQFARTNFDKSYYEDIPQVMA